MKNRIYSLLTFVMLGMMISSCYEEPDFLSEIVTSEGRNFPVIADFTLLTTGSPFKEGTKVDLDLDYWSLDEIATIKLYQRVDGAAPTEVASYNHTTNFQADSQTDQILMSYTIPVIAGATGKIVLDAEVINVNGLIRNTSTGGTGNRPSITLSVTK